MSIIAAANSLDVLDEREWKRIYGLRLIIYVMLNKTRFI